MLKTGNHEAERAVRGQSLVYLTTFHLVNPAASIDEARAYLHNMDPAGVPWRLWYRQSVRISDCVRGIEPCECKGKGHRFQRVGFLGCFSLVKKRRERKE